MGDIFLSDANLPHRAVIKRPGTHDVGEAPGFDIIASVVKCWLVPEGTRREGAGFGFFATGRYQLLFKHGVNLEVGWRVDVTERQSGVDWKLIGTYEIESVIAAQTHTEAVCVRQG